MLAMSRGGTYDHVEGGFFRYSTTRDWSVPHFEKMAEDHAGLLRVLAGLMLYAPTADFRATLISAVGYVRAVLRDPRTGFFAGSQDADEEYYELPLEQRRAREAPFVDRTSYTNWTCALAGAQCQAARALDDDALLAEALRALDNVDLLLSAGDGLAVSRAAARRRAAGPRSARGPRRLRARAARRARDLRRSALSAPRARDRRRRHRTIRGARRRILRPARERRRVRPPRACRPSDRR